MNFSFKRKLVKIRKAIDNLSILILINVIIGSIVSSLLKYFDVLNFVVLGVFFSFVFVLDFIVLFKLNKVDQNDRKWNENTH